MPDTERTWVPLSSSAEGRVDTILAEEHQLHHCSVAHGFGLKCNFTVGYKYLYFKKEGKSVTTGRENIPLQ